MVVIVISEVAARNLPVRPVQAIVLTNPYESVVDVLSATPYELVESSYENHNRHRREAYDPYAQYYYFPSSLNDNKRKSNRKSTVNRRQTENGPKFAQSGRRKLFVPNLFG